MNPRYLFLKFVGKFSVWLRNAIWAGQVGTSLHRSWRHLLWTSQDCVTLGVSLSHLKHVGWCCPESCRQNLFFPGTLCYSILTSTSAIQSKKRKKRERKKSHVSWFLFFWFLRGFILIPTLQKTRSSSQPVSGCTAHWYWSWTRIQVLWP